MTKTKRLGNTSGRIVTGSDGKTYNVLLEHLRNDYYGNPRYKASIIWLENGWITAYNYTFTGHYCGELGECEWIVERYIQERDSKK